MVLEFNYSKKNFLKNKTNSWKGKKMEHTKRHGYEQDEGKGKERGKNISKSKIEKRGHDKKNSKKPFESMNPRGFGKRGVDQKNNFYPYNRHKIFNRNGRFSKNEKNLKQVYESRNNVHVENDEHNSRERKNEKFGKMFPYEKKFGETYGKGKFNSAKKSRQGSRFNSNLIELNTDNHTDKNVKNKKADIFQKSEETIEKKKEYDICELFNNVIENKVMIKHVDPDFIKHVKRIYDMSSNEPNVFKQILEKIVIKKVLKGKGYVQYDDVHVYIRKLCGKLNIPEDKIGNKQNEIKRKEKTQDGGNDINDNIAEGYGENDKKKYNKKDKNTKMFKKKVLFMNELEELFYIDKTSGEIKMVIKAWKNCIITMLRNKFETGEQESWMRTEDIGKKKEEKRTDKKEKKGKEKEKEKGKENEKKKHNIRFIDVPILLRNLYKVNEMHIAKNCQIHENNTLKDDTVIDLDNVLKGKINVFEVSRIVYNVGLNLINKNFELFVKNNAEDEDKIYLDIINNKNNIFVDRVNNISVLIKKNPWVYIMYLKVLLDLYHLRDNTFAKKTILRCLQYVFTSILPNEKLKNFEENNKEVLTYILNMFYNRFNFKHYSFSCFYFFFNALIYLYSYEQFLKNLLVQFLFILQNGIYCNISSLFYTSTTYLGQLYIEKKESRLTILNMLIDGHMKIKKGNPLTLNMLKYIIDKDEEAKRYICTILFEKTLMNLNSCVIVIKEVIKQNKVKFNYRKYNMKKEKGKGNIHKKNKKNCILTEVKTNIAEIVTKFNRCLYILYKMKHSIFDSIEEDIFSFVVYLFELFSVNIFEVYERRHEFFGIWNKDKINLFNWNTSKKVIPNEQLQQANDNNLDLIEEMNKINEKGKENDKYNINIQEMVKLENTESLKSLPTNKEKEIKEEEKIEMKTEKKKNRNEWKEERRNNHNLYYYLSNVSIKLVASILFKNIYNIIQKMDYKRSNNGEIDFKYKDHEKRKDKITHEPNKGLHILNCNSIQNIIKHIDSYQVKIHLLNILFIVASSNNQLDDDMYCYFYTALKEIDFYENENSPNFYAMLTVLILTDHNLSRNISFIKRIFQFTIHSKEHWVQIFSLMMMRYILLKKKALSNFLYYEENELYQTNLEKAKEMYINKCKKYNEKCISQINTREFVYNSKFNNPLDSNALLTHFYEFYDFSSLLNDHFFNILLEFRNWTKFGSLYFKRNRCQYGENIMNPKISSDGLFAKDQEQVLKNKKEKDHVHEERNISLQKKIAHQKIFKEKEETDTNWKKKRGIDTHNKDIHIDDSDDIVFNYEETTSEILEPCYTLELNQELDTVVENNGMEKKQKKGKKQKGMYQREEKEKNEEKGKKEKEQTIKEEKQKNNAENIHVKKSIDACNWDKLDFPAYSFGTKKILEILLKLKMEFLNAKKYMNTYFTFMRFINDSHIYKNSEEIQNNKIVAYKLSDNIYQKNFLNLITLFHNNNFKVLNDKYKKKKERKEEEIEQREAKETEENIGDSSDTEEEADEFLDQFIYKNFDIDADLVNDNSLGEIPKKKKTQKRKRNCEEEQIEYPEDENDSTDETYSDMSEDEAKNILEFEDYVKMKKGKME